MRPLMHRFTGTVGQSSPAYEQLQIVVTSSVVVGKSQEVPGLCDVGPVMFFRL